MKILSASDPTVGLLVRLIKKAKNAYYNTGQFYTASPSELPVGGLRSLLRPTKGEVTDSVFDSLEDALREIDPSNPILKSVGHAPKKRKIKLPFRMPSLDKVQDLASWLEDHDGPYVVSDKIDGISIGVVNSVDGRLAFTRGDGLNGGDITYMADELGLPSLKSRYKARGEIVMPVAKFNALWAEQFANPRNMVGGITNRNSLHEALAHCKVYMYELIEPRMRPSAGLAKLKSMGFRVVPHKVFDDLSTAQLTKFLVDRRAKSVYEMDGLVVTQDVRYPAAESNPHWSVAFKDKAADDSAVVTVVEVDWRPTRTGKLFPRVVIEPVKLKGVTVTYCSGKSAARIKTLGIGPGAKIEIARSGDVIPDIRRVLKKVKWQQPAKSLGSWEWEGESIVLTSHSDGEGTANSVNVQQITFFFTTLGVDRFKAATIQKFVDAGYDSVPKILKLNRDKFLSVPGTSQKVLSPVWTQLQSIISQVPLHTLMYSSGVFGRNMGSRRIAGVLKAIPDILDWSGSKSTLVEAIDDVEGFDLITARQFASGLPKFLAWLKSVPSVSYTMPKAVKLKGKLCANQRVVMTGFRDAALQKSIVEQGGEVVDSIKRATYLLAKDVNGTSIKLNTARQLKVPILTAEQFRRKFSLP